MKTTRRQLFRLGAALCALPLVGKLPWVQVAEPVVSSWTLIEGIAEAQAGIPLRELYPSAQEIAVNRQFYMAMLPDPHQITLEAWNKWLPDDTKDYIRAGYQEAGYPGDVLDHLDGA